MPDWQISVQNKEGESPSNHSDNPTLALTAMVSSSDGDDHRYTPPPTSNHGSPTGSTGKSPSIELDCTWCGFTFERQLLAGLCAWCCCILTTGKEVLCQVFICQLIKVASLKVKGQLPLDHVLALQK